MHIEQWKTLEDFPNYEISSLGKIRKGNFYLTPSTNGKNKRLQVKLSRSGGVTGNQMIARLVYRAFKGDLDGRIIAYKDNNPQNCAVSNLTLARKAIGRYGSVPDSSTDDLFMRIFRKIAPFIYRALKKSSSHR